MEGTDGEDTITFLPLLTCGPAYGVIIEGLHLRVQTWEEGGGVVLGVQEP